jgi:hypothetical protein
MQIDDMLRQKDIDQRTCPTNGPYKLIGYLCGFLFGCKVQPMYHMHVIYVDCALALLRLAIKAGI